MKKLILYYFLLITSCTASFSQATIQQLLNNGTNDEKINIVILSEGYRESELTKFITDANKVLDYIFKQVPFSDNKTYFNAFAISVASNESGSDKPASNIYKDTYFNSTYNCNNIQRLICLEGDGMSKAFRHLVELIPDYDIPVMIVNDNEYGGSGGSLSIISNNPSSITAAVHEIGHSFASLADEYESAYPGYNPYEKPNVTAITSRDSIKWKSFILQTTPIPTPETSQYSGVIGLFEGAMYQTKGWYRPKMNCMMRSLGIPFCEVCSTEVLKKVRSLIEPPRISINFVTSKNLCPGNSFVVSVLATKAFNKPNEYTIHRKSNVNVLVHCLSSCACEY